MGSGEKEWKESNDRWEAQERVNEKQRAESYKANLILWATKRSSESAKKDIEQEATAADGHHNSTTTLTKDKALKPSTEGSIADSCETTTSEVQIMKN